jgi:hypothetical protein
MASVKDAVGNFAWRHRSKSPAGDRSPEADSKAYEGATDLSSGPLSQWFILIMRSPKSSHHSRRMRAPNLFDSMKSSRIAPASSETYVDQLKSMDISPHMVVIPASWKCLTHYIVQKWLHFFPLRVPPSVQDYGANI